MNYKEEIKNLIISTSKVIGKPITENDFYIEHQPCKHKPKSLPKGKMAVYTFVHKGCFLKVGQANFKSNARYQSQHYNPNSSNSNLAKSLIKDKEFNYNLKFEDENIGQWIMENCERFDVIIDKNFGKSFLNFIEGLLQYKYSPKYEG